MTNNYDLYPCFVVYTGDDFRWEFQDWLEGEGFIPKRSHGGSQPWIHVYLEERMYLGGKLGISFGHAIGDHAISIDDFKTIYYIYEKYLGTSFMLV